MRSKAFAPLRFLLGVGLALLLLLPIPQEPFWFDEVFTANLVTFQNSPKEILSRVATGDAHPPLFYLLAYAWAKLWGLHGMALEGPPPGVEVGLRSLSTLLSALSIGVLFLLFPLPWAFLAGGLVLASPHFLLKAWEARMYPLLGLLLLLSAWALLERRPRAFALFGTLALYTHYLALLALLPPAAVRALRDRSPAYLFPFLAFTPWFPTFLLHLGFAQGMTAIRPDPIGALYLLADLFSPKLAFLLLIVTLLILAGKDRPLDQVGVSLALFAFFPLWWLLGVFGLNTYSERYLGAFAPLYAYLLLREWKEALPRLLPFLYLPVLVLLLTSRLAPPTPLSEPYLLLREIISRMEGRVEAVYSNERGRLVSIRYYYRGPLPTVQVAPGELPKRPSLVLVIFPQTEGGMRLHQATKDCREILDWRYYPFSFRYCP